ncbi:hypothetical protein Ancab_036107 [Ancistrocladus abbreviatus]
MRRTDSTISCTCSSIFPIPNPISLTFLDSGKFNWEAGDLDAQVSRSSSWNQTIMMDSETLNFMNFMMVMIFNRHQETLWCQLRIYQMCQVMSRQL